MPAWIAAPYVVAILGGVMPDRIGELRTAQERARAGNIAVPEHMIANLEALHLANEFDRATLFELAAIGRAMAAEGQGSARRRADRKRRRELRARLGLTGTDPRRPVRIPRGLPAADREVYELAIALRRTSPSAARRR